MECFWSLTPWGGDMLTLLLQHLVGFCNLHLLRQADCPAVQQLQDLILHLLRRSGAQVLQRHTEGELSETAQPHPLEP